MHHESRWCYRSVGAFALILTACVGAVASETLRSVALWIVTEIIYVSALLRAAMCGVSSLVPSFAGKGRVWMLAAMVTLASVILSQTHQNLKIWSEKTVPILNLFFVCALFPTELLIGKMRAKRSRKNLKKSRKSS